MPGAVSGHLGHVCGKTEEKERKTKKQKNTTSAFTQCSFQHRAEGREGQSIQIRDTETIKNMT